MKISFHGACKEVTGSCHLVKSGKTQILIDCGMFQGGQNKKSLNKEPFGFNPKDIDYLVLTHAHLDHVGRIPLLHKQGFRGEIISTPATRELARIVMLDSAHLQEEDAKRKSRNGDLQEPLYTTDDVNASLSHFSRDVRYGETIQLAKNVRMTTFDAGHILGSAFDLFEIEEGSHTKKILFSGDLGNSGKPIVKDPDTPPKADVVVMESTYGDRLHKPFDDSVVELYEAIDDTFDRSGNFYISTFAIERAQELIFILRLGIEQGFIPKDTKIILDSPMAISATEVFKRHPECFDEEARRFLERNPDPFNLPNLTYSRTKDDSKAINDIASGAVVLAGSGMCNGGRILHHLKNNLGRKECGFAIINFAPRGTLARNIIDGKSPVKIFGVEVPVNAKIYTIGGFSAHAGQDELLSWQRATNNPDITFLTHGDPRALAALSKKIGEGGCETETPELHDSYNF